LPPSSNKKTAASSGRFLQPSNKFTGSVEPPQIK
jgi:hypothetical protein